MRDIPTLITGSAHPELARAIAQYLEVELTDVTVTAFPDGETFIKINENIRGRDVFIIQPTCPPTNQNIMELLIMVDAARRASAARITAVIPFFGYARQDRKDQPRVPITSKLVANLLVASGVNRVVSVDLHAEQIQGFFDIPVDHLYAAPVIIKHLRSMNLEKLAVVAPDVGSLKMASYYTEALNARLAFVTKERKSATDVSAQYLVGEVEGCHVLLVDDMTETAGTITAAAALLKRKGALSVRAGLSHTVLTGPAAQRLEESEIAEIITTDSTPVAEHSKVKVLSIAELLGEAIHRIHDNASVTSLFEIPNGR